MIEVIHNPNFLELTVRLLRVRGNVRKKMLALKDYKKSMLVALVPGDDLETAFRLTNTIDKPWVRNEEVANLVLECRSTSVGDFMKKGKTIYMVSGIGYIEIGKVGE